MALLKDRIDIRLLIMGEGSEKAGLERVQRDSSRVFFAGHHGVGIAKLAMRRLCWICKPPLTYTKIYPSKTVTYIEQGCPLMVAVGRKSPFAYSF